MTQPAPRPFQLQARSAPPARRHWGRRAAVLCAAVAVPALAAPGEWRDLDFGSATAGAATVEPMPFEKPGESFPGSAFYYLAPDAPLVAGVHSGADEPLGPGAIARALRIDNSGVDRTRAEQCLTAAIYYEAASESDLGQRAVAQVVLNRVAHPAFPKTVCGVVYQGSERSTGCQFSFTCDGSLARVPSRTYWLRAAAVAAAALGGYVEPSVGLATHYHTLAVHPAWDAQMVNLTTIGAHTFFRFPGRAGLPGAFSFAYGGGEPLAAPHAHDAAADRRADPALDPLLLAKAYEAAFKPGATPASVPAADSPRAAPAPAYAPEVQQRGGDALYRAQPMPQAGQVRPEYAQSGQWIAQPGS